MPKFWLPPSEFAHQEAVARVTRQTAGILIAIFVGLLFWWFSEH